MKNTPLVGKHKTVAGASVLSALALVPGAQEMAGDITTVAVGAYTGVGLVHKLIKFLKPS